MLDRAPRSLMKSALFRLAYGAFSAHADDGRDLFSEIRTNTAAKYLGHLGALAREHRFEVLVAWFPRLLGQARPADGRDLAMVKQIAHREGFHFLDLANSMTACAASGPISEDSIHPNEAGHRCAGEAIAEYAERQRLVAP